MATFSLHRQIAAVQRGVDAAPEDGALAAALTTLVALSIGQPALEQDDWSHTGDEENLDRLLRAMEGLMP